MSKKQFKELLKLSESELEKELATAQESQMKLRFQRAVEENKDTSVMKKTRRKIARIKTLLHQQRLAAAKKDES